MKPAFLALALAAPLAAQPEFHTRDPQFVELLGSYCFECHGNANAEAEINLEEIVESPDGLLADAILLQDLLWSVEDEEMPPAKADKHPRPKERQALIAALSHDLEYLENLHQDDPGRVIMPRLTRDEYENVIRDLSGGVVALDAARFLSAPTRAGEGFTNVGEAHGSSLGDIEGYLDISRQVLQHVRVGPASGLRWSDVPVEDPEEAKAARKRLVLDVLDWHTLLQDRLIGTSHFAEIEETLGVRSPHAAYLEAAWRYRWREQLGHSDATLETIATDFDPPLFPASLERWWKILQDDDAAPILAHTIEGWKAIPGPDAGGADIVRERCDELLVRQRLTTSDFTLNEGPMYETTMWEGNDKLQKQTMAYAAKEGWMPFEIEVGDSQHLYLIVTDAYDGGEEDLVLWHGGAFHQGEREVPWQQLDPVEIIDPVSGEVLRTARWGRDADGKPLAASKAWTGPEGEPADPAAGFSLRAPAIARLAVPEGAERFTADIRVHREIGKQSSFQALILRETEKIEGDWAIRVGAPLPELTPSSPPTLYRPWMLRFYPWRHVMGVPGSDKVKQANRDYRHARLLFKSGKLRLGRGGEKAIFAAYDGPGLVHLGGPWDDQREQRASDYRPYEFTLDQLRGHATEAETAELEGLYGDVPYLGQPAYQRLHELVVDQGVKDLPEGKLPAQGTIAKWDRKKRDRFETLLGEIREFESELVARAEPMIGDFAARAWRRPLSKAELAELMEVYRGQRRAGTTFEHAVKLALRVVLCSPNFLYRAQDSEGRDEAYPLDDWELASRLSFALWGSIPDDELRQLAADGKLTDPEVLRAQARRLLADPKSEAFATEFAGRWFGFSGFEFFAGPDPEAFPEFTDTLRSAMYREGVMFFSHLFRENRPISEIVDADYSFLNEELAAHYGIDGVRGAEMRRVEFDDPNRGGVLGFGSVLTTTSKPLRTSPVNRGVWLVEQVVGQSLPEVPAGLEIPELSREATDPNGLTVTEQLELHREAEMCSSCHIRIDPFGIALQNFDPVGKWRDLDPAGKPVDAKGVLKDGSSLDGIAGLKRYLKEDRRDKVTDTFCRKLVGYLLGRATGPGDARLIDEMKSALEANDLRFTSALDAVLASPQFLMRRDGTM